MVNPTQEPCAIWDYIIKHHSAPADYCMELFPGSGSATVAGLLAGRNMVAIDNDGFQVRGLQARIQDVQTVVNMTIPSEEQAEHYPVTVEALDNGLTEAKAIAICVKEKKRIEQKIVTEQSKARAAEMIQGLHIVIIFFGSFDFNVFVCLLGGWLVGC